ncbi:MAG: CRISPR-associated RAMP protein Csx7 [Nitrososphaerota archaeon]|nr:CRISPR-associated RAMP protein Csx7 [Candidatus Bathyarchaeota archaeon]MDW8062460.1 CRISPR-associated RAMP protein Csx7 [Nitrososphaerota archaeon]
MVFEKLDKRLVIEGTIEALTPLHIGSGRGEVGAEAIDLPVLRAPDDTPYIPGSSFKGKIRSEAEKIARAVGLYVCTPPDVKNMCGTLKKSEEELCIVCRIFGTAGVRISRASKVKFRDAYPEGGVERMLVRTGIAMDRERESVYGQALYTIEAVPKGTRFRFEIVAENLADEEFRLFKAALKSVADTWLGGQSSRGFGKVKLTVDRMIVKTSKYYLGEEDERTISGEEFWSIQSIQSL